MNFCGDGLTQCNLISPFPGGGSVVKNSRAMQETWVQSLGQEHPLEKEMATTPVFLPGKTHGQRSLVGSSPWGRRESDTTEPTHTHPPTHTHTHTQLSFSCHDHMGSGGSERVTAQDGTTSSVPLTAEPTVFWPHSHLPALLQPLAILCQTDLVSPSQPDHGQQGPSGICKGSSHFPLPALLATFPFLRHSFGDFQDLTPLPASSWAFLFMPQGA